MVNKTLITITKSYYICKNSSQIVKKTLLTIIKVTKNIKITKKKKKTTLKYKNQNDIFIMST